MKKFVLFVFCMILFSCTRDINGDSYQLSSVGEAGRVEKGVIVDVREVKIQGNGEAGTLTGGVAGGVAASTVGRGGGSVLASVGGALLGALVGGLAQRELTEQTALQYIVRLKNGEMISVVQGMKNPLAVGQRVFVLYGRQTRLIADDLPVS